MGSANLFLKKVFFWNTLLHPFYSIFHQLIHVDISTYELINFDLTPGSGGGHSCGGGGGGVLVNGKGPGYHSGMGEGYGGGGEGCDYYDSKYGSPGAILIEIKK